MDAIRMEPIGTVVSDYTEPEELWFACEKGLKTANRSKIFINDAYMEGLVGLDKFSHAFILYHLDRATRLELTTHPGPSSEQGLPKVGVFASRSQYRPNHIALRLVRVVRVKGNELCVEGLDAINGSQVLDIKPYVHGFDRPENFSCASWYDWLRQ